MGKNYYADQPGYCFWKRAVQNVPLEDFDPVVEFPFQITPNIKVGTAGSCFAQHIARSLKARKFNYFVTEPGHPALGKYAQERSNYGTFSARYGNIYTSRQLVQLFDRAYGAFSPSEEIWTLPTGRYCDPFRPQIEPDGFYSRSELLTDRMVHFAAVRRLFEGTEVFVFTLGLTETWFDKRDGAVFPLAPGVAGGIYEPAQHGFLNLGVSDVVADLDAFLARLSSVNEKAKVILTVSPVPLMATAENRHVWVSTTLSKAVLRAAADEVTRKHENVGYFPSFEVITALNAQGAYYDDDFRSIKTEGVQHVMKLFMKYVGAAAAEGECLSDDAALQPDPLESMARETQSALALVCEEEALAKYSDG